MVGSANAEWRMGGSFVARLQLFTFFFFNDTATTEIYTLSLHDALPICRAWKIENRDQFWQKWIGHPQERDRLAIFGELAG